MPAPVASSSETRVPVGAKQRLRQILTLALPIIGAMASQNVLNVVDMAMVGQLGAAALAAVGFGSTVNWFVGSFFIAMGVGVQAIAARRTGEQNPAGAVDAIHTALLVAGTVVLPFGLVMAWFSDDLFRILSSDPAVAGPGARYLAIRLCTVAFVVANFSFRGFWNGIGRPTVYLRSILVIHAVNLLFNWLLIFGHWGFPALGVAGAALASAIAVVVGTGIYATWAWRAMQRQGFMRRRIPAGTMTDVLRLSIPTGWQNLFLSAGFVAMFRLAQCLGTREVAAANVVINVLLVCMLPAMGFGLAAATLVGQSLGRARPREAGRWGWWTSGITLAVMAPVGLILAATANLWLPWMVKDAATVALVAMALWFVAAVQPFDALAVVLGQALLGAGAVRAVMATSVVLQWLFFLPLVYVWAIVYEGGWIVFWIAMLLWRSVRAVVMVILFARGRWQQIKV